MKNAKGKYGLKKTQNDSMLLLKRNTYSDKY